MQRDGPRTSPAADRTEGLAPLDSRGATILTLGSFPSIRSLEKGEYYGHPRNHFWPILAAVARGEAGVVGDAADAGDVGEAGEGSTPATWSGRMDLAARLGVAIWDVVASCRRKGSLDAAIRDAVVNDIGSFVSARPDIGRILFNGGTAAAIFGRSILPGCGIGTAPIGQEISVAFGGRSLILVRLPSTSPVPTAHFPETRAKLPFWRSALRVAREG